MDSLLEARKQARAEAEAPSHALLGVDGRTCRAEKLRPLDGEGRSAEGAPVRVGVGERRAKWGVGASSLRQPSVCSPGASVSGYASGQHAGCDGARSNGETARAEFPRACSGWWPADRRGSRACGAHGAAGRADSAATREGCQHTSVGEALQDQPFNDLPHQAGAKLGVVVTLPDNYDPPPPSKWPEAE